MMITKSTVQIDFWRRLANTSTCNAISMNYSKILLLHQMMMTTSHTRLFCKVLRWPVLTATRLQTQEAILQTTPQPAQLPGQFSHLVPALKQWLARRFVITKLLDVGLSVHSTL
jgi:hypothetical protein